jgi:MFS family permease
MPETPAPEATSAITRSRLGEQLARKRPEVAFVAFGCIIYFVAYFQRVAVPGTVFNELQTAFAITATQVGGLSTVFFYIYGSMQFCAGPMTDRLGAARVLLLGGVLLSVGSLLFPLSQGLIPLYAARALVGFGASLIFISLIKALDSLFHTRYFPPLQSIIMVAGNLGGLAATFPFERAVHAWSWRPVLASVGLLCLLATGATTLFSRRMPRKAALVPPPLWLALQRVVQNPQSLLMFVVGPLNFGIYFLVQTFIGKKFLLDYAHLSSAAAAGFTFIMMLVTIVMVFSGGFVPRLLGDRRKPFIIAAVGCTTASMLLLLLFLHLGLGGGWLLLCYLVLGLGTIVSPVGNALMRELNPPDAVGTSIGLLNGACYLVVAVLITVAGVIMDHFRAFATLTADAIIYPRAAYTTMFLLCTLLGLVAVTAACFLRETFGRSVYAE